jgi:hypothetical protein
MNDRGLITTGTIGAALAVICCATSIPYGIAGGFGLSARLAKDDYTRVAGAAPRWGAGWAWALPPTRVNDG